MYHILLLVQNISTLLIIISIFYTMRQTPSQVQKDMILLQMAILITNMSCTLEMKATDIGGAIVATKMGYLGRPITTFAMFFLIVDFARIKIKPQLRTICASVQVIYILIVFTFEKHGLYYKSVSFVDEGIFPHLVKVRGPLYPVFTGINILFCVGMIVACFVMARKAKSEEERNILSLFGCMVFFPIIGSVFYFANILNGYNVISLGYVLATFIFVILFKKYDVFGTVNVAWENVFKFIGAGLLVYDRFGRLIYQNEKAKEIDIADRANELYKSREYIYRGDNVYRVEKLLIGGDDSDGAFAYYIDNETDNYNYEEKLREEKKRADEASVAKTQFLANMSHDIRTPMNAILGLTSIATININNMDKVKECLEKIKTSGNHLIDLINEVLDINKIESGKFELVEDDFDIVKLVNQIEVMTKTLVEEREHTLSIDTEGVKTTWLRGDKSRLSQTLMNLVSNSIKYTNNGGLITIKINETNTGEDSSVYKIVVRDNGIGMSEEYMKTLFDPFTRAKDEKVYKTQGTGLGMTITKQFVELMNGTIDVKSSLGIGTTFTITVPIKHADESTRKDEDEAIDLTEVDLSDKRVLVVEDNETNAEVMKEFLKMTGVATEFARDGVEAIELINSVEDGYFDLIFMDGEMPRMNGYETAAKLRLMDRKYANTVPIIAVTGNAFSEDVKRAFESGMNAHIIKPVEYNKLYEVMKTYLFDNKQ
ncbi:MAG: ATP-binding protein [Lachnospiraceae bacterium]|nr:ATP-binding protein [Lachnospiraceae bacterium]